MLPVGLYSLVKRVCDLRSRLRSFPSPALLGNEVIAVLSGALLRTAAREGPTPCMYTVLDQAQLLDSIARYPAFG